MPKGIAIPNLENALSQSRFDEAVKLARGLADAERSWLGLGRLLSLMEKDHDYQKLGFDSIHELIGEIKILTGYGRSSMYRFKTLYEECSQNGDPPEMPLSSAHVFKQLPAQLQCDPEIIDSVKKMKPKQFKQKIADNYPVAHIEIDNEIKLHPPQSVFQMWREAIDGMRLLENSPTLTHEAVFENLLADWLSYARPLLQEMQK